MLVVNNLEWRTICVFFGIVRARRSVYKLGCKTPSKIQNKFTKSAPIIGRDDWILVLDSEMLSYGVLFWNKFCVL